MSQTEAQEVWDEIRAQIGDDLRVVAQYDGTTFDTVMREDVRERYSDRENQTIVDTVIIDSLGYPELQAAFRAGRLTASVKVFDDAWVVVWPDPAHRKRGFMVSIERGRDATMADVESCLSYLETAVGEAEDGEFEKSYSL